MCNLYRLNRASEEIAGMFGATVHVKSNAARMVYPGYPAPVIVDGEMRTMTWGFPLSLKGKSGHPLKSKPVNNARTDKLGSPFWRSSFENRRCLIPVEAFAEAEGPRGQKTRTWISLPEDDMFACAGIWRSSDEWGDVFSMVMTDASDQMRAVHNRMPVILPRARQSHWLKASPAEAKALCTPYPGELTIKRTEEPWAGASSR